MSESISCNGFFLILEFPSGISSIAEALGLNYITYSYRDMSKKITPLVGSPTGELDTISI